MLVVVLVAGIIMAVPRRALARLTHCRARDVLEARLADERDFRRVAEGGRGTAGESFAYARGELFDGRCIERLHWWGELGLFNGYDYTDSN